MHDKFESVERPEMANETDKEIEELEISGSKCRGRLILYCVISYAILVITVPLCFLYLPTLFDNLPCPSHMSVPLLNPKFHPNGSVEDDGDFYYANHLFTIDDTTRGCKCQLKPCIRKCCAEDEHMVKVPGLPSKCGKNPKPSPFNNFSLPVHYKPEKLADVPINHFDILFGDVCTFKKFMLNPTKYPNDAHSLMTNGYIFYRGKYWDTSKYCLDSKNGSDLIYTYVCFEKDEEADLMFIMYPIFLLFSSIFLIATFLVYSVIPDLRNLHGKSLMCYIASLFVTYVGLSVTHITGRYIYKLPCIMLESSNDFPCNFNLSAPLSHTELLPNWSVTYDGVVYPPGQYFTVNNTIRGCICALKPCIRKCCGEGEFYVRIPGKQASCQNNPSYDPFDNLTIPVYNNSWQLTEVSPGHFRVLYGDVCRYGKYLLPREDKQLLMVDGKMFIEEEEDGYQAYKDASQYCLDSISGSDAIRTFICFPLQETKEVQVMFTLYSTGMMISIPFMVATFVVHGMVSELRNLHGKTLMSHTASLCISYISLTIIQIGRDSISKFWCVFLAFTVQFTFLASFFWTNVMCFDIWWVFSGLRAPRGSAKERDHKKFVLYSVYAWGVPAVIVAISLIMDLVPSIPDSYIKPGFGSIKCWFKDYSGKLLYFYLPIAIVVLLNITMFVSTACKLRAHTKETKVLHGSESRQSTKADRDRFNLYLKLFVVMGINWVLELVSFFGGGPKSLWFVTDIGNTLQGVLIFLIFVCKRRVMRLVNQKLCPCWIITSASTSGPSQSGSSHTHSTLVSKTASDNPSTTPQ